MNTDMKRKVIGTLLLTKERTFVAAVLVKNKIVDLTALAREKAAGVDASGRRKIIAASVVLAVVLLTGGSYLTGKSTERTFRSGVEEMAQYGAKVTVLDYRRGVFGATARTEWVLSRFGEVPVTLFFNHNIRHGPMFPFSSASSIRSELKPTEGFAALLVDAFGSDPFGGKPPLTIKTTLGWGGESSFRIVSPKFKAAVSADQARLSWDGLSSEFLVSSGRSRIRARAVIGGLSIGIGEDQFETGRVTFRSEMTKAKGYESLFIGMSNLVLDKLSFRGIDENTGAIRAFTVENVRGKTGAALADGMLDIKIRFDADKAVMGDKSETAVNSLGVTLLYENFDAQVLEAIFQAVLEQNWEHPFFVFEKRVGALLGRRPAFSVTDLGIGWPEGVTTGNFRIAYTGDGNLDEFSLDDLTLDVQFGLPTAPINRLLERQAVQGYSEETKERVAMINALINRGFLTEENGVLSVDASLRDGALKLNGKPEPLETLGELLELL